MKRKALYRIGVHILIIQMLLGGVLPCHAAEIGVSTLSEEEGRPAVTSVSISPGTTVVSKNATCAFTASVAGENDYSREVAWSVSGQTSQNTFIDGNGVLNVASDETASSLIVKAVSRQDSNYSASALVTVQPSTYHIQLQASPDNGGSVYGSGDVKEGGYAVISAVPNEGFTFEGWRQNNNRVSQDARYVVDNIHSDATYVAEFKPVEKQEPKTYTITASVSSAGGTVTPEGKTTVTEGSTVLYTITPKNGYAIRTLYVDGKEIGKTSSFNFTDVRENHSISADFVEAPVQSNSNSGKTDVKDDPETKPEANDKQENKGDEQKLPADDPKEEEPEQATGTLAELKVSVDEAKRLIKENKDGELLAAARNTGDLQLIVRNDFMDREQDSFGVPDIEKVPELLLSGEEKLEMLQGNMPVTIELAIKDTEGRESQQTKEAFEEKKLPGITIGRYFEVSLRETKKKDTQTISELPEELKMTVCIPEHLKAENRKFYILRLHTEKDGSQDFAQLSDEDDNPDTITFSTHKFSSYAIGYIDWETGTAEALENTENVTGNNSAISVIMAVVIAIAIGITSLFIWYITVKKRSR